MPRSPPYAPLVPPHPPPHQRADPLEGGDGSPSRADPPRHTLSIPTHTLPSRDPALSAVPPVPSVGAGVLRPLWSGGVGGPGSNKRPSPPAQSGLHGLRPPPPRKNRGGGWLWGLCAHVGA